QPEVSPQIALRKITSSAGNFANLRHTPRSEPNACSHGIPVAFGPDQSEVDEVVACSTLISQQQRWIAVISYDDVNVAVIIEVRKRRAPGCIRRLKTLSGGFRHLGKFPIPLIVKQSIDLLVVNVGRDALHFFVHMSVGDEDVEPPIIVIIEESAAEAEHIPRRTSYPGSIAHFIEKSLSIVMPYVVGRELEI